MNLKIKKEIATTIVKRVKLFKSLRDFPSIDNDKYKETRSEVHELIYKSNFYVQNKLNEYIDKRNKLCTNLKKFSLKIKKSIPQNRKKKLILTLSCSQKFYSLFLKLI